jgi:long-subunit acyl-CoA synthetase (AMP-forming)
VRRLAHHVLFVEDDEQLDKALEVRDQLPLLRKIVVFDMDGLRELNDPGDQPGRAARLWDATTSGPAPRAAASVHAACKPEDLAILVYTSGTTGKPKGAMHSHHGLVYTVRGYNTLVAQDDTDERMCFLPLCHIAERMGGEYFALYTGAKLNFVENPETVPENVREIAPTVFTAVPRVWEKFYSGVMIALKEAGKLQQLAYSLGHWRGHTDCRQGAGREPVAQLLSQVHHRPLDRAEQRAQAHRHSPCALLRDRRGAHFARAGQVVPGAGRAHAGGMGHDRNLWRVHRSACPAHEAGLHWPGRRLQRSED